MSHFNDHLDSIVRQLQAGYNSNELFFNKNGLEHPNPSEIIDILNDFRQPMVAPELMSMPVRLCACSVMMRGIYGMFRIYSSCAMRYVKIARSPG